MSDVVLPAQDRDRIQAVTAMAWTFDRPVGMTAGVRTGRDDVVITEGPARLTWDGETADGWIEKSLRPSALGLTA